MKVKKSIVKRVKRWREHYAEGRSSDLMGFTKSGSAVIMDRNGFFVCAEPESLGRIVSEDQAIAMIDPSVAEVS